MKTYKFYITVLLLAATVAGCNKNSHIEDHDHLHDEKIYLTAYSPEYEVYVIADPFHVGEAVMLETHITSTEDFKPITNGSVKATLNTGSETLTQTLTSPATPGIFSFELLPSKEGTGKLTFEIETDKGVSVVEFQAIEVEDESLEEHHHEEHHTNPEASSSGGNNIRFLKEQSWKIDFSTEEVKEDLSGQIIRTAGQVKNTPDDARVISSAMAGIVLFSGNDLFQGTSIKQGQSLFRIDASGMADNNLSVRMTEIESEYNRSKSEYERKEKLAAERIVSESELNRALAEYKSAEANYNNLKNNFKSGSQQITSPISGYVIDILVDNGEYVEAGQPVMTVSQNRKLIIQADIQPKYYDILSNIRSVNIRMMNSDRTYSLEETGGRILSFSKSVNLKNPLITLTVQFDNGADMLPGSFVELFLKADGGSPVINIPNESIVEEMGNYFVYVQQTPELFEKRLVEKGASDGRRTVINKGLTAGERVVGKGAVMLKLSQSTGSVDVHSGHVH